MDRELYVLNLYLFFKIVIFIFRELFVGKKFYFSLYFYPYFRRQMNAFINEFE